MTAAEMLSRQLLGINWDPKGAEWTLRRQGSGSNYSFLSVALFSVMHVSNWPRPPDVPLSKSGPLGFIELACFQGLLIPCPQQLFPGLALAATPLRGMSSVIF